MAQTAEWKPRPAAASEREQARRANQACSHGPRVFGRRLWVRGERGGAGPRGAEP